MDRPPSSPAAAPQLRPAKPEDREFLFRVYAASRAEELARVPWSPAEVEAFLRQQFDLQDSAYRQDYPTAAFEVIEFAGQPAGRLYLERSATDLHLIDIALLPEHRGRGIGTGLIHTILAEAADRRLPIRLYVEQDNPARRLYKRLGFTEVEEHGPYLRLAWTPPTGASTNP